MRPSSPSHSRNGEHTSSHQPPAAAVLTNEAHLRSFLAFSVSHLTTRRVPGRRSRWCASVSAVVVVREGRKRGGNERTVDLSPSRPTRTRTLAPPARQDDEPVAPNSASRETERQPTQKPSMPPTDAAPPSPDHPKSASNNDDDDDDEGSPVVEAPVSLEQRQPGAFSTPTEGGGGTAAPVAVMTKRHRKWGMETNRATLVVAPSSGPMMRRAPLSWCQ